MLTYKAVYEVEVEAKVDGIHAKTKVYLASPSEARKFRAIAEERGWSTNRQRAYISGDVGQAIHEVEREIALMKGIAKGSFKA